MPIDNIQNMRILRKQVNFLIQVVESVLQFRIQGRKNLLQHLSSIRKQIKKSYKFQTYDETIFSSLVPLESYAIRSKFISFGLGKFTHINQSIAIQIKFKVFLKSTNEQTNEENWLFSLRAAHQFQLTDKKTSNWALLDLLDHIIRHLLYHQLLPRSHSQRPQKNKYMVDYSIQFSPSSLKLESFPFANNSWFKKVFSKTENAVEGLSIECCCFYRSHEVRKELKEEPQKIQRMHKKSQEEMTTCTRRVSLFERYDEDLEMVVLSGNDSMREEIELSEICLDMEEEEEFQMLVQQTRSRDQVFVEENSCGMKELASMEKDYFQYL